MVNERTLHLPTPLPTKEIQGIPKSWVFAFLVVKWPPIWSVVCQLLWRCYLCFQSMQNFNKQWELCVSWLTQLQVFIILRLINLVTIKRGFNCLSVYWCNFLICNKGIRYISFSAHWLDTNISIMFPCFCKNVLVWSAEQTIEVI